MADTTPRTEEHFLYNREKTPSTQFDYKEVLVEDAITYSTPILYAHDAYITMIEWRKKRVDNFDVAKHEFLVLFITEKQTGDQYERHSVAILERLADPKTGADTPDQNTEMAAPSLSPPSHTPKPALSSRSSSVSSGKSIAAIDQFVFTIDSTDGFIAEYEGKSDILKTLTLNGEDITLAHVLAVASAASKAYPKYHIIRSNCYYFAQQSYYLLNGLVAEHKKKEVDGLDKAYVGKNIIKVYGEDAFAAHHETVQKWYKVELDNITKAIKQLPVKRQEHDREVNRLIEVAKRKEEEAKKREYMLREEAKKKEEALSREIQRLRQLVGEGSNTST